MGHWWVIVPFRAGAAKSRLSAYPAAQRADLARSFASDTCAAAIGSSEVAGIIVIGDEVGVPGVPVVEDPGAGLNAALTRAARDVPPGCGAVALMADLPALRAKELTRALSAVPPSGRAFVCDAEGTGTTMLAAADPLMLDPRFGPRSRAAHAASGALEIDVPGIPGLRRDVDDAVSLWDAVRIGVGPGTRSVLERGR